jgi:hypothetical protein
MTERANIGYLRAKREKVGHLLPTAAGRKVTGVVPA